MKNYHYNFKCHFAFQLSLFKGSLKVRPKEGNSGPFTKRLCTKQRKVRQNCLLSKI